MTVLIITLSFVFYATMGFLSAMLYDHCLDGDAQEEAIGVFFLWPAVLLPLIAYWFLFRREKREKSVYSKAQRQEIAAIKHQIEVTKLQAELEDITTARLEKMR